MLPPEPLTRGDLAGGGLDASKVGPAILAAFALLMIGFVLGRVTSEDDTDARAEAATTIPPLTFPQGDQDRADFWAYGGVTPALADAFDRDDTDTGLGNADTGAAWSVVSGDWRIDGNGAAGEATGDARGIAVVAGGSAERLSEVTLMTVEEGAGLVFRYVDRRNYWAMTATATGWAVSRVVDGQLAIAAEVAGPVVDGTTITVAQRSAELQILVDGQEYTRVTDGALRTARASGVTVPAEGSGTARFDRFYVGDMPVG